MHYERSNAEVTSEPTEFLILMIRITGHHFDEAHGPFHHLWGDLCVVFSRRHHVNSENRVGRRLYQ